MLALKPSHRALVMAKAEKLPAESRQTFVDRVVGRLQLNGGHATLLPRTPHARAI